MVICWLVLTGVKNGSLSNALKSSSKNIGSSVSGVVKNSLFVTLSGNGLVIVGSSRTSSRKCARSMTAFFNDTATPEIYTLSLRDALPI
mgnify:CR=1 FL=1